MTKMRIEYGDRVVELTPAEVFDFSVTLGAAKRSKECSDCVLRAREVWTKLGVWGDKTP